LPPSFSLCRQEAEIRAEQEANKVKAKEAAERKVSLSAPSRYNCL